VQLISEQKLEPNVRSTYWKGTVALLILHSQCNTSMTTYGTTLLNTLNNTSKEYFIIFLDGLKEVFVFSESLTLGQHTLIGNLIIKIIHLFSYYHLAIKLFLKGLGLKITLVQYSHQMIMKF